MITSIKNNQKIFSNTCRVYICNYFYNNKKADSLLKWSDNVLNELKEYVEEIYIPNLEIDTDEHSLPYFKLFNKRYNQIVKYEVFMFFGNVNTLNKEILLLYNKFVFLKKDVKLTDKYITCFWGIMEGTSIIRSVNLELINRFFDEFWVGSQFVKDNLDKYDIKSIVVPNGINHNIFKPNQSLLNNQICKILCVATDVPRKNLDLLVNCFIKLNHICLILKTNTNRFQNIQSNIITLDCDIPDDKMAELINQCHFAINVSISEGFGLPLCEAIACGKRIIAPYYGGIKTFANPDNIIPIPHEINDLSSQFHDFFGQGAVFKEDDIIQSIMKAYEMYQKHSVQSVMLNPVFYWKNIVNSLII